MGLNIDGLRFLLHARDQGVSFNRVLTIGRQNVSLSRADINSLPAHWGFQLRQLDVEGIEFAEPILKCIGANEIDALDITAYEGATLLHDLNQPIPEGLYQQYDLIFDGGALEHIFNVPQAIHNYMRMLRVGGHMICANPVNNFAGHGFYQFSPELFFSVFSPSNGFLIREAVLYEDDGRHRWYRIKMPKDCSRRLTFQNCVPAHLIVLACKEADMLNLLNLPQQNLYTAAWSSDLKPHVSSLRLKLLWMLPSRLSWFLLNTWVVKRRFRSEFFSRWG